ncbi:PH domain-containing protein [Demequina sp. NBRC 110054]|uniref:PH domain-containing protein n=1 Tax=Demequina sp. NBRC 110054 TaxID=1570343 RepID=UPI000A0457B9|nr:PH domain-containing protein [Demequina sp. NBRC 110054]
MTWFEPEGASWTYVDRKLIPARLISFAIPAGLALAATVALAVALGGAVWIVPAVVLVVVVWAAWVIVRQVGAHAWAERDDDLLVKRGRMFRRVTVVPYGRMQFVEVEAGPIARSFGLARVQLHTAAPGTDASISGVPTDEAARLRDRLTARGEATLAGL